MMKIDNFFAAGAIVAVCAMSFVVGACAKRNSHQFWNLNRASSELIDDSVATFDHFEKRYRLSGGKAEYQDGVLVASYLQRGNIIPRGRNGTYFLSKVGDRHWQVIGALVNEQTQMQGSQAAIVIVVSKASLDPLSTATAMSAMRVLSSAQSSRAVWIVVSSGERSSAGGEIEQLRATLATARGQLANRSMATRGDDQALFVLMGVANRPDLIRELKCPSCVGWKWAPEGKTQKTDHRRFDAELGPQIVRELLDFIDQKALALGQK